MGGINSVIFSSIQQPIYSLGTKHLMQYNKFILHRCACTLVNENVTNAFTSSNDNKVMLRSSVCTGHVQQQITYVSLMTNVYLQNERDKLQDLCFKLLGDGDLQCFRTPAGSLGSDHCKHCSTNSTISSMFPVENRF